MKLSFKPSEPQTRWQKIRDGGVGAGFLILLGLWAFGGRDVEPRPETGIEQITPSAAESARAEEDAAVVVMAAAEQERLAEIEAEERAAAEKAEAERLASETKAAEEAAAARAEAKAAEDAREKRYGFHCLSGWDGSHLDLVSEVKRRLNDPRSFEHAETRTWSVTPEGRNQILMTYRARNGFGAMMLGKAVGTFDNETCDIDVESID